MRAIDHRMVFEGSAQYQATRTKVVAYATVIEEMLPHLPLGVDHTACWTKVCF